jgi:hypothetical protein
MIHLAAVVMRHCEQDAPDVRLCLDYLWRIGLTVNLGLEVAFVNTYGNGH